MTVGMVEDFTLYDASQAAGLRYGSCGFGEVQRVRGPLPRDSPTDDLAEFS